MNLNERIKSLFEDISVKPSFSYVDGLKCIEMNNFSGFDKLYINYMEKDGQPMGFSIDAYSKFFQRFFAPSLEIGCLVEKHPEEYQVVRRFFNFMTGKEEFENCSETT